MRSFLNIVNRSVFLYVLLAIGFVCLVNRQQIQLKTLNHFRNSARYVNNYAIRPDFQFDAKKFYHAAQYHNRLVTLLPEQKLSYGVLGYVYFQLNQPKKMIKAYERASIERDDLFGFHYNLGILYYQKGEYEKAVVAFKKAIAVGPQASIRHHQKVAKRMFHKADIRHAWLNQKMMQLKVAHKHSQMLLALANDNQAFPKDFKVKLYYYIPLIETGIIPLQAVVNGNINLKD